MLEDLNDSKSIGTFNEQELQKIKQTAFRIEQEAN